MVIPAGKEMNIGRIQTKYGALCWVRDHEDLTDCDGPYKTFATLEAAQEYAAEVASFRVFENAGMRFANYVQSDVYDLNSDGEPGEFVVSVLPETEKCWGDLDEEEREQFAEEFYRIWHRELDFADDNDGDTPSPWGAPWEDMETREVETPEEYFRHVRRDIEEVYAIEETVDHE